MVHSSSDAGTGNHQLPEAGWYDRLRRRRRALVLPLRRERRCKQQAACRERRQVGRRRRRRHGDSQPGLGRRPHRRCGQAHPARLQDAQVLPGDHWQPLPGPCSELIGVRAMPLTAHCLINYKAVTLKIACTSQPMQLVEWDPEGDLGVNYPPK